MMESRMEHIEALVAAETADRAADACSHWRLKYENEVKRHGNTIIDQSKEYRRYFIVGLLAGAAIVAVAAILLSMA